MNIDDIIDTKDWKNCWLFDMHLTLENICEIGQWCDNKFGKEGIKSGWWMGPSLEIHFRDDEMFVEFVLTWL